MLAVWLFICAFFSVLLELQFGRYGAAVPWFAVCAFYFGVIGDWRLTVPVLLFFGSLLDLAFGRHLPCQAGVLAVVLPLAAAWRRHGDCGHRPAQAVPGFAVGATAGAAALVLVGVPGARFSPAGLWRAARVFFEYALSGAVCLPLVAAVLDRLAGRFDLPRYRTIQKTIE